MKEHEALKLPIIETTLKFIKNNPTPMKQSTTPVKMNEWSFYEWLKEKYYPSGMIFPGMRMDGTTFQEISKRVFEYASQFKPEAVEIPGDEEIEKAYITKDSIILSDGPPCRLHYLDAGGFFEGAKWMRSLWQSSLSANKLNPTI